MNAKDIKNKLLKAGNQTLTFAIVAAVSSGVTYYECKQTYDQELAQMADEVKTLREKQDNAIVTQRISEQMEDIAYQQKAVSDKQRERAEEQSRRADIERGKAEFERGVAQQAEAKALKAADEADRMRLMAEQQTKIATDNMLVAQEARAQADTLFYLSLSRSLAQAALRESAGGTVSPLTRLLSYASWHYSENYGGNGYKQDMYRALIRTSGLLKNSGGVLKGNIRYISVMNDDEEPRTLMLTDYGEMMFVKSDGTIALFYPSKDDFRSMARSGKTLYALSSDGKVKRITLGNAFAQNNDVEIYDVCTLPAGIWSHLLLNEQTNQLVAISDKQIAWIDLTEKDKKQLLNVADTPSCIGMQNGAVHLFTKTGKHYVSVKQGDLTPIDIQGINGPVTAYYYNDEKKAMVLGMSDGIINIVDKNYNLRRTLTSHNSSVTHIDSYGPYLISSSYDKTIKYWGLNADGSLDLQFDQTLDFWPLTFDIDPLTHNMWIGTASGYMPHVCIDIEKNAQTTRSLLEREFTDKEWDYYIGKSVPRVNFMIGKEGKQ